MRLKTVQMEIPFPEIGDRVLHEDSYHWDHKSTMAVSGISNAGKIEGKDEYWIHFDSDIEPCYSKYLTWDNESGFWVMRTRIRIRVKG